MYLVDNNNGLYWKITFKDDDGNILGTFGDGLHCDDINFRKQTFYIMKILNNWDLLKLDGQEKTFPVLVDNEYSYINYISNNNGEYLKFDYQTGEVLCGSGCDVSELVPKKISSLVSRSGVLMVSVIDNYSHRAVSCDMSYLGFSPVYEGGVVSEEQEHRGARYFKEFVYGILQLCGIRELIQSNNYPEVSVEFDSNGNIIGIGDIIGDEWLYITENGYEFVEKKRKKR